MIRVAFHEQSLRSRIVYDDTSFQAWPAKKSRFAARCPETAKLQQRPHVVRNSPRMSKRLTTEITRGKDRVTFIPKL
jgi:hypothetical protein